MEQIVKYRSGKALGKDLALPDLDTPRGDVSAGRMVSVGVCRGLRSMSGVAHGIHLMRRLPGAATVYTQREVAFALLPTIRIVADATRNVAVALEAATLKRTDVGLLGSQMT